MAQEQSRDTWRLRVLFDAALTDFLWIEPRLAGSDWPLPEHDGCSLRFLPDDPESDIDPRDAYGKRVMEAGRVTALGAALFEVRLDSRPPVSAWDKARQIDMAPWLAARAAHGFIAWCKTRQPWIGPFDASPEPVGGVLVESHGSFVEEPMRNDRRRTCWRERSRPEGPQVRYMDEPPLSVEDIKHVIEHLKNKEFPDPASAFLADAHFAAFCTQPRDLKRAILLAAFACELRTRAKLREHVRPEARPLLDELFPGDRQARVRTGIWTGSVAKALVGRSLQEENAELYDQLGNLVRIRNQLVHRGVMPPDLQTALEVVRTARKLFIWLDTW